MWIPIFFSLVTLSFTLQSHADCGLSISTNNINIDWNLNFTHVAVQIRVDKANADSCSYGIGISKGGASSYSQRAANSGSFSARYQIYKENSLSNIIKDVPDITSDNDVLQGGFQTGTNLSQIILYYLDIPYSLATTPTLLSSGTYNDTFTINLYEGDNPLAFVTPVASASMTLTVQVLKMIALSLVDSGGGFSLGSTTRNINLGTLAEGSSASFDLRIRTNAGFSVTFSSTHNGKLHHINPAKNSLVPYLFYANSSLLNLSTSSSVPVTGLSGNGQTTLSGLAYPLRIVVGSLNGLNLVGGNHQDDITITATTTE
ncbi:MAG: hypothetical protein K1X29_06055 [Bdellovibrionales bacterium]|nr:hypothetical protein [Bdellovibrionales bacterium]